MRDFGKSVAWPRPPVTLMNTVETLKRVHSRWRAYMILKPYPPAERPSLRLKICAAGALFGKRVEWGYRRKWEGNYLFLAEENVQSAVARQAIEQLRTKDNFKSVLFACFVKKTNRFSKCADRAILITDMYIYKLNPKNFSSMTKEATPVTEVTGVSVSGGPDQLFCIHLTSGNDLVTCLQSRRDPSSDLTGEAVGTMVRLFQAMKRPELRVNVGNQLQCMLGNKPRNVSVQPGGSVPVFRKNGTGIVLNWPEGSNIPR